MEGDRGFLFNGDRNDDKVLEMEGGDLGSVV